MTSWSELILMSLWYICCASLVYLLWIPEARHCLYFFLPSALLSAYVIWCSATYTLQMVCLSFPLDTCRAANCYIEYVWSSVMRIFVGCFCELIHRNFVHNSRIQWKLPRNLAWLGGWELNTWPITQWVQWHTLNKKVVIKRWLANDFCCVHQAICRWISNFNLLVVIMAIGGCRCHKAINCFQLFENHFNFCWIIPGTCLTHSGLVMQYVNMNLGQHWLR